MTHSRFSSLTLALLCGLVFVAGAGAATLAVTASQPKAGTAAAPNPETLALSLTDIGYVNNKPSQTVVSVTEQLPKGFNNRLALFPTCAASEFSDVGNTPPPCPTGSQTGTISFRAFVPSLDLTATAAGYVYRTGDNAVDAWVLAQIPGYKLAVAVPGKLTDAGSAGGPSVTWNLSAAINFGVTADITQFDTTWSIVTIPVTTTVTTPAERSAILLSSSSKKTTKTKAVTSNKPESVFETSACTAGTWNIVAGITYKSGSPETDSATVACTSATATTTVPAPTSTPTGTTTTPGCISLLTVCLARHSPADKTRLRVSARAARRVAQRS